MSLSVRGGSREMERDRKGRKREKGKEKKDEGRNAVYQFSGVN